jgi:hypothetical protein
MNIDRDSKLNVFLYTKINTDLQLLENTFNIHIYSDTAGKLYVNIKMIFGLTLSSKRYFITIAKFMLR